MTNLCIGLVAFLALVPPAQSFSLPKPAAALAVGTPQTARSDDSALFGRRWRLTEVNGAAVKTTKPYIEFDREAKRFSGHGGCNRISGGFELDGTTLRLSPVVSTEMGCLDSEIQRVETNFFRGIEQTTHFQIQDDILRFSAGGAPALTIAEQVIRPDGRQVPIEFALQYDQRRIDNRHRYSIQARILEDSKPRFTSTQRYLVITGGHPSTVNVIVKPVGR